MSRSETHGVWFRSTVETIAEHLTEGEEKSAAPEAHTLHAKDLPAGQHTRGQSSSAPSPDAKGKTTNVRRIARTTVSIGCHQLMRHQKYRRAGRARTAEMEEVQVDGGLRGECILWQNASL